MPTADGEAQPRVRRTQAERREEASRRLLEAALRIVASRGSVRMTLAEVGEAAGYSRGLPAHRFGNKAGLVQALAAHIGERYREMRMAAGRSESGLATILASIDVYFGRDEEDWVATRALLVLLVDALTEDSELREHMVAYNRSALAFFERHIRKGIESGEIAAGVEPETMAVLLLGAMRGVALQALSDPNIDAGRVGAALRAVAQRVLGVGTASGNGKGNGNSDGVRDER